MSDRDWLTRIKNRVRPLVLGVTRDRATGHLFYEVEGVRLYIRFPEECLRPAQRRLVFDHVYFAKYLPRADDCVVDIGAGLGTEIVRLARISPGLHYVAVEIQPWVYECLSLTLAQLPSGFRAFPLAIGDRTGVRLQPSRVGLDASIVGDDGAVEVAGIAWSAFVRRHGITSVDLLKMNVEGAEAELLEHIDLACVKRVIVGVHDFRADRGEGEVFRTRSRVEARLREAGFALEQVVPNWIYASRPE